MKKKGVFVILICCLFLTGCAWGRKGDAVAIQKQSSGQGAESTMDRAKTKLTIWMDEDNEYEVRNKISMYALARNNSLISADGLNDYCLDIQWNLVEKNYLSPKQYQQELAEALENGEGPDIIYMDTYNGVDPEELIKAGVLADLGDITSRWKTFQYVAGALEGGLQDGKNYVMPLYMECPIVFGIAEELEKAGIRTQDRFDSLEEFLDALLAAQEKTEKQVFEDDSVIDWLEEYDMPDDKEQAAVLTEKLEQLRAVCGNGKGKADAYRGLTNGECLLGGCGVYDYKQLAGNLSLFGKDQQIALFCIPDSKGDVRGIITHSVAVNADSQHVEEAVTALSMFQLLDFTWMPDIPVLDEAIDGSILEYQTANEQNITSVKAVSYKDGQIPQNTIQDFLDCIKNSTESVTYVQKFADRFPDVQKTEGKKNVITISYEDHGGDPDDPITKWLERTAEAYEQKHDGYIQFMRIGGTVNERNMHQYGVAADATIGTSILGKELVDRLGDFSMLQQESDDELKFLPDFIQSGVEYDGKIIGLPLWAKEFGIWCKKSLLIQAGLSQDWKPANAQEMTDGLRKLRKILGTEAVVAMMNYEYELYKAMSMFLSEPQEKLLEQQEDGSWCCSKEGWISYLSCLQDWSREKLVVSSGDGTEEQVALALADGEIGAWIGSSSLIGWFDGSYGLQLTQEQQEDIFFISLSPAAITAMLRVSDRSDHVDEVFSFWKEAIQSSDYEQAVRESLGIPVTELSETVKQLLPAHTGEPIDKLRDEVWNTDLSAEELAEKYPWFAWTLE